MTKSELQDYWDSDRPVVFVTDFMRQPNDPLDPPNLNLPRNASEPLLAIGPRKLYGNAAARKLWQQKVVGSRCIDNEQGVGGRV